MSQVIVVNDLSNLGEQLKAALAGSGIDASQFGDIGVQIQKALAGAGLGNQIVSGAVEVEAPEVDEPLFGELLDTEEDEYEFTATYNVKNAADIALTFNESGNLDVVVVSKDGEENTDEIDCDELVGVDATAYVENDVLYVSLPKLRFPESGDSVNVINFNPIEDESDEDESDEDCGCDCETCTAEREESY
jgi:hypothetical protein